MPTGVLMRLYHFATLALLAPIGLAAQQPPAAPAANPVTTAFRTRIAAEDTTTADSVKATWPKAKLVTRLKESFAFCDQAIAQLDDAKLGEQVTITFGGNSRTVARAGMALGHAIDLADHYSQLANYMRLNNILPPTALPRPRPAGS